MIITFCHGLRCEKHYGKPKIKSEGKRPVQRYLATGCSAVLRHFLILINDSNGEKYKVTKLILDHNHPVSAHTLQMYFKNRNLTEDEIHEIKPFIEMNVETKSIRQYVSSKIGESVINKDISNAKQKEKTEKVEDHKVKCLEIDVLNELTQKYSFRRGRQHSFVESDHEIFSTVILSLPLIQERQLSVSGERMCTILVNRLED